VSLEEMVSVCDGRDSFGVHKQPREEVAVISGGESVKHVERTLKQTKF